MTGSPERYATSAFAYDLPPEQIAQHPAERRDESRLLVLDRARDRIEHRTFRDFVDFVPPGDVLVLNETRVFPARLLGHRAGGAPAEVLLLRPVTSEHRAEPNAGDGPEASGDGSTKSGVGDRAGGPPDENMSPAAGQLHDNPGHDWLALVRPGNKLKAGRRVMIADDFEVEILGVHDDGSRVVRLRTALPVEAALERYGHMPLPPYVERADAATDAERYQTVYARATGSVAAPTAGLHFTEDVLAALEAKGVELVRLVLHVGVGTFRPVEVEDPAEHRMHEEWYEVPAAAAAALNTARASGRGIWAVGTTVTRTLETVCDADGAFHAGSGWTDIFIRPPYEFRGVDHLLTNFHLPRSTLLMLVAAFGGYDRVMQAYAEAVGSGYRFYSYGDAMLVI